MQNTNMPIGQVIKNHKNKILYTIAIIILVALIAGKAMEITKPQGKSQMDVLVEKQQNNLVIIGKSLEDQKILRNQINELQSKLDGSVKNVKEIEAINLQIRNEMLEYANTLSPWSNE